MNSVVEESVSHQGDCWRKSEIWYLTILVLAALSDLSHVCWPRMCKICYSFMLSRHCSFCFLSEWFLYQFTVEASSLLWQFLCNLPDWVLYSLLVKRNKGHLLKQDLVYLHNWWVEWKYLKCLKASGLIC